MVAPAGSDPPRPIVRLRADLQVELATATGSRVVIRTFPEDQHLAEDLAHAARELVEQVPEAELRERLERELRIWYPRVTIHVREDLASLSREDELWYAMRDGRIHAPEPRLDRLHAALANAREVASESDQALSRAREVVEAVGSRRPARPSQVDEATDEDGAT